MNAENLEVLGNIIGAVESGGQTYGKKDYASYVPPFTNSEKEYTITLGWAQNYGYEARKLLRMIKTADPEMFAEFDTEGKIARTLDLDWIAERLDFAPEQRLEIQAIISSIAGIEAQNKLFSQLMQMYIRDCQQEYSSDIKVQMMYCEIRHLGGKKPVNRIFKRAKQFGEITLQTVLDALHNDQNDSTSSNQVGDAKFWSRHTKCAEFIQQYAKEEYELKCDKQKIITWALNEVGYLEKKDGNLNYLYDKTANAGSNNYTKYGYEMHKVYPAVMDYPAYWCDAFIDNGFYNCYGLANAKKLLGGNFDDWTHGSMELYKDVGAWHKGTQGIQTGDQIFFGNSADNPSHTGLVVAVDDDWIITVEGNTSQENKVIPNGGAVCKKKYPFGYVRIIGYGRPAYDNEKVIESYPRWIHAEDKWYYRLAEGQNAHGWLNIPETTDNKTLHRYYFDDRGVMATDWKQIDGQWYYFQPNGGLEGAMYVSDAVGTQHILYI